MPALAALDPPAFHHALALALLRCATAVLVSAAGVAVRGEGDAVRVALQAVASVAVPECLLPQLQALLRLHTHRLLQLHAACCEVEGGRARASAAAAATAAVAGTPLAHTPWAALPRLHQATPSGADSDTPGEERVEFRGQGAAPATHALHALVTHAAPRWVPVSGSSDAFALAARLCPPAVPPPSLLLACVGAHRDPLLDNGGCAVEVSVTSSVPTQVSGVRLELVLGQGLRLPADALQDTHTALYSITPSNPLPVGSGAQGAGMLAWSPPGVTLRSATSSGNHRLPLGAAKAAKAEPAGEWGAHLYGWSTLGVMPTSASSHAAAFDLLTPLQPGVPLTWRVPVVVTDYTAASVRVRVVVEAVDEQGDSRPVHVALHNSGDASSAVSAEPDVSGSFGMGGWASALDLTQDGVGASWLESVVFDEAPDHETVAAVLGMGDVPVAGGQAWAHAGAEPGSSFTIAELTSTQHAQGNDGDGWALAAHAAFAYADVDAATRAALTGDQPCSAWQVAAARLHPAAVPLHNTHVQSADQQTTAQAGSGASSSWGISRLFGGGSATSPAKSAQTSSEGDSESLADAFSGLHGTALHALQQVFVRSLTPAPPRSPNQGRTWADLTAHLSVALPPPAGTGLFWVGPALRSKSAILSSLGIQDPVQARRMLDGQIVPRGRGGLFRSATAESTGWIISRAAALSSDMWVNPTSRPPPSVPGPPIAPALWVSYLSSSGMPTNVVFGARAQSAGDASGSATSSHGRRGLTSTGSRPSSMGGVHATGASVHRTGTASRRLSVAVHSTGGGSMYRSGDAGSVGRRGGTPTSPSVHGTGSVAGSDLATSVSGLSVSEGGERGGALPMVHAVVQESPLCPLPPAMLIQPLPLHTISTQLTRHEVFRLAWNTALPDGHSSATWGPSAASPVHAWAGGNTLLGPLHKPLANKLHTRRVLGPRHSGGGPPASAAHALAVTVGAVSGAAAAAALGGPSPHPSLSNHALIVLERAEHSGPAGLACVTVNHSTHKPGPDTTECAEWHAGFAGLGCTGAPILLAVHAQRQALDALGCMRWTLQCQALTRDASLAAAVFGVVEAAWASQRGHASP